MEVNVAVDKPTWQQPLGKLDVGGKVGFEYRPNNKFNVGGVSFDQSHAFKDDGRCPLLDLARNGLHTGVDSSD